MSTKVFLTDENDLVYWDFVDGGLTNRQTKALGLDTDSVDANSSWVVCPQRASADNLAIFKRDADGELGARIDKVLPGGSGEGIRGLRFSSTDENILMLSQRRAVYIVQLDSNGDITVLDSISRNPSGPGVCDWNQDDTVIAYGGSFDGFVIASWDGSSITEQDTFNVGDDSCPRFYANGSRLFVWERNESSGSNVFLYAVDGASLTLLDAVTHPVSSWEWAGPDVAGKFAFGGVRDVTGTPKIWDISGDTLNEIDTFGHEVYQGTWVGGTLVVTSPDGADDVFVYGVSAGGLALEQSFAQSIASDAQMVSDPLPSGPTTPEELFQASYADASAADPKVTALIRPADVQRSIDTDVSNLKDGPNLYTVEVVFDIGELENLNPYNSTTEKPRVFFVKDDQPGLRAGKNLLLKGYTIRDANPAVPVTCTFWG